MASAHIVETSVANNSPQHSNHPDDHFTPEFKPFSYCKLCPLLTVLESSLPDSIIRKQRGIISVVRRKLMTSASSVCKIKKTSLMYFNILLLFT